MFPVVKALDDSLWLAVETDFSIVIHPEAELDGIADILQSYIDAGDIPNGTNEALAQFVLNHRGQEVTAWSMFPDFFKNRSKDKAAMIAQGLLADADTIS